MRLIIATIITGLIVFFVAGAFQENIEERFTNHFSIYNSVLSELE